jgi:hypothetical protein
VASPVVAAPVVASPVVAAPVVASPVLAAPVVAPLARAASALVGAGAVFGEQIDHLSSVGIFVKRHAFILKCSQSKIDITDGIFDISIFVSTVCLLDFLGGVAVKVEVFDDIYFRSCLEWMNPTEKRFSIPGIPRTKRSTMPRFIAS